jgi:diguanylate cyclase
METLLFLGGIDLGSLHLPLPVALAAVATVGYLIGRRNRAAKTDIVIRSHRELRRAQSVAEELEKITWSIRKNLAQHHARVLQFKDRVSKLNARQQEAAWKDLCREAEEILKPTLHLAAQIATAYDGIRQQSTNLMSFTEVRTDPLTGLKNRRGLDDALGAQFALFSRYGLPFSVVMFDIDHFKHINDQFGHLHGDQVLHELGQLFDEYARETDIVARYGGEEFVVVMPQTDLDGACIFAQRLREGVQDRLSITISGGVAEAITGDTQEQLLARADAALYQAKTTGRNCVLKHDGRETISAVQETAEEVQV